MGLFNSFKDHFNKAEFSITPNKKLKRISSEFKATFNLSLVFYKGNFIADSNLTLSSLDKKTSNAMNINSKENLKIKASMKVGKVEDLFLSTYGIKVQIKDNAAKKLINNDLTLGDASRQ